MTECPDLFKKQPGLFIRNNKFQFQLLQNELQEEFIRVMGK